MSPEGEPHNLSKESNKNQPKQQPFNHVEGFSKPEEISAHDPVDEYFTPLPEQPPRGERREKQSNFANASGTSVFYPCKRGGRPLIDL